MHASTTRQLIPFRAIHSHSGTRPLILIIDDEPAVPRLLAHYLLRNGFQVITAEDGGRGTAIFFQRSPAVAIVDILMPVQDGIETIIQMRRQRPSANIIAMSGGGQVDGFHYLSIAVKLGANLALEKPIDLDKLLIAVRTLAYRQPVAVAHY